MIWQLSMGDLQTYQESKEYVIIVIVYKLNPSTIKCWYTLKIYKKILLHMANNTKIYKFNVRTFKGHSKKYC